MDVLYSSPWYYTPSPIFNWLANPDRIVPPELHAYTYIRNVNIEKIAFCFIRFDTRWSQREG